MTSRPSGKGKSTTPPNATAKNKLPFSGYTFHLILALIVIVVLVGGYLFYSDQERLMKQSVYDGLSIVTRLKAEQVAEWRAARLVDINTLAGSPSFSDAVERYLASPADTETRDKVLADLAIVEQAYPYQDVLLTDVNGNVLLNVNNSVNALSDMALSQLAFAINERKAVITDFHYPAGEQSPHLDVVAPLFPWGQDSTQAIGAVLLCIDPSQYLYPLMQYMTIPTNTAETLLVERDGDDVLFLNELRHQKDTALKLRIPLNQQENPAVMAVLGKEGVVKGKDYRGVEVFAALKHIPDSPWYMVTKIDVSEALSSWRARAGMIIAFFSVLLVALLAAIGFIWQRRQRVEYQALYQAETEAKALRSHFEYLVKYANDIIILVDEKQNIVEVNDRALEAYGYTPQEMLGMRSIALIAPDDLSSYHARLDKIQREGTIRSEAIHRRKDGSTFPVEISGRTIKIDDKRFNQLIIRDITERKRLEQELQESEEKYRALVQESMIGIGLSQRNRIVFGNQALLSIWGYDDLEEFTKIPLLDHIAPASKELVTTRIRGRAENKVLEPHFEFDILRKDGKVRTLSALSQWITFGGEEYTQTIFEDITELKQMQEALRQSEERYRTILDAMEESYYELDMAGNFTFVNDALCRRLGRSREEVIGMNYKTYTPDSVIDDTFKIFNNIFRTGKPVKGLPILAVSMDGRTRFVERSIFPMRDSQGKIVGFRGISHDITERKRTEDTLRQSEEKYRTILNEIFEVYYELDLAGNYTFFNDALCRQTGYSREELTGMNYRQYTPEEDWKSNYKIFNRVYRTGESQRLALFRVLTRDGRTIYTEDNILPLYNEKGEIIGFRGLSRDVTVRMRAEEDKRQMELKAQITGRLAAVGEMTAGIAHEINNPLTGVTGYAQLLMDRDDIPPEIRSDLAAINDGAQRVAGIVQRLLSFSRQTRPERKLVDINDLIESTLILRAYHLRVSNIEVVSELAPELLETVVDPGQIQQVLLNLIVNAETEMKLAHGKGKLTITTEKVDGTIKIYIKDNGPGIKPEIMDRIFDPFFTTREVGQGTGLGLSLCYGIVTEHNGKIHVESKSGKGATFIVELPVISEVGQLKLVEPIDKQADRPGNGRILVVDDEPVVRDVVSRVLSRKGYEVDSVDKAADALNMIGSQKYDLILLDIKMPGTSGVQLYKRIKKIDKTLTSKVIFITGDVMSTDTRKFLTETKAAHIEKPFEAERLIIEIERALGRST